MTDTPLACRPGRARRGTRYRHQINVTMSLHKLTGGSGYDYLTRQVAALDATDKGHVGLSTYYAERGESPGTWIGAGMAGLDGLHVGDTVTAEQMQALFGSGHHPLAVARLEALGSRIWPPSASPADIRIAHRNAICLGSPFRVCANDVSPFRIEVAKRLTHINRAAGLPDDAPTPPDVRAHVRTELARELFQHEHGRPPQDARELASLIARHTRSKTTAVAGFDLTFSPVKSVSTLWALANRDVAAAVEQAHVRAVHDALRFIEARALFTRLGTNGVRQVDVRGLVATAFTHRDSRAGDPDLHTHVAVANKVQTLEGQWRAIDGRTLYAAAVAASETYNTALERHLTQALGVRFTARMQPDLSKRPVREVDGIDERVNQRFSKRRHSVEHRRDKLAQRFQADHGRPPTPVEMLALAQQATLETRDAKHEPRTLDAQRAAWRAEASSVLGSSSDVDVMLRNCLDRAPGIPRLLSSSVMADVVTEVAATSVNTVEQTRATWRYWHVYAEAQRQVRCHPMAAQLDADTSAQVAHLAAESALRQRSVSLDSPPVLRVDAPLATYRADGGSVYEPARSKLYTSPAVLDAERRLTAAAGLRDGHVVPREVLENVLANAGVDGSGLNIGQAHLVREMATSGARLQIAIAPAGSGKTTAMMALSQAWLAAGGNVVGLAPSAAAAQALGSSLRSAPGGGAGQDPHTDTLAKLVHTIRTSDPYRALDNDSAWVYEIDDSTLVIIDEAGMADTLSLDAAVAHVLRRGGSVRLVGDDQQLAAVGAGGVLRDIQVEHGSVHLTELLRFDDPIEGAATMAVRDGRPEALGFYLDRGRIHVGDTTTVTEQAFTAWVVDRDAGLDAVLLAPTRELAAELNARARAHRLATATGAPRRKEDRATVLLADGNQASSGDVLITRRNDRRLRISATDWVKNGDRWLVTSVDRGGVTVRHLRHHRSVRLPSSYVHEATALGYACTVHAAQGITADTTHGVATGQESRQLLYTMLTRGRSTNHLYLQVVGDGDPHTVIRPEMIRPETATDVLASMLARDRSPRSASTVQRQAAAAPTRLGDAAARYVDSLHLAADHVLDQKFDPRWSNDLEQAAEQLVPGLLDAPAWPTLRARLALLGVDGRHPTEHLTIAVGRAPVDAARDLAAALEWRLPTGEPSEPDGPLPWLPSAPAQVLQDPTWGSYVRDLALVVQDLADDVRRTAPARTVAGATAEAVDWAPPGFDHDPAVIADIEVWRAATKVDPSDRRPTGGRQHGRDLVRWQQRLDNRVPGASREALLEWSHLLGTRVPGVAQDAFAPVLAQRLAALARAGLLVGRALDQALESGPLPDEHAAAALSWRMSAHVAPEIAVAPLPDRSGGTPSWSDELDAMLGHAAKEALRASRWWPVLAANIDRALERGWRLSALLGTPPQDDGASPPSDRWTCEELVWRTSIVLDPVPPDDPDGPPPELSDEEEVLAPTSSAEEDHLTPDERVVADLHLAGMLREAEQAAWRPPPPTEQDIRRGHAWAQEWDDCPVPRDRMLAINALTLRFFESQFPVSWAQSYLAERLNCDIAGDERFRPGYAPAGWTNLVDHLREAGVTDDEMLCAGVAKLTKHDRLIDQFRDRLTFPILDPTTPTDTMGFVGRRSPRSETVSDGWVPPKYLNSPTTPLFHKDAQLFGAHLLAPGMTVAPPTTVVVEGPLDAIAVTLASAEGAVGLAPLGTAFTEAQARQLAEHAHRTGLSPIVATDPDEAGRAAAERAFWMLTPLGLVPRTPTGPGTNDPADLLATEGPAALAAALATAGPLHESIIAGAIARPGDSLEVCISATAAVSPDNWEDCLRLIADGVPTPQSDLRRRLRDAIKSNDNVAVPVLHQPPSREPARATASHQRPTPSAFGQRFGTPTR